jgi:hypothetical protein
MEGKKPNPDLSGPNALILFACNFCGQRIRIPRAYAGKKGKCPKCHKIVLAPKLPSSAVDPVSIKPDTSESKPFPDIVLQPTDKPEYIGAPQPTLTKKEQFDDLRQNAGLTSLSPEPPPERKYPWLIDIFLYPANIYGLFFLGIVVLIPLAISILASCLGVFAVIIAVPAGIINTIIYGYIYWFLTQCVLDSAAGNIRVSDTIAETPGPWEIVGRFLQIIACLLVCAAPAAAYFGYMRRIDLAFWLLAGGGTFFYPMALLSVLMFDSFEGLNPLIIIPSIFSTFFQYCGLVVLIGAIIFLLFQIGKFFSSGFLGFVLYPLFQAIILYLAMITAHLLGRFYFKYQEKLNWEV